MVHPFILYYFYNIANKTITAGENLQRGGTAQGHKINFNQTQTIGNQLDAADASVMLNTQGQPPSAEMAAFVINNNADNNTVSYLRPVKLDGQEKMPIQVQNWTQPKDAK